MAEPFKKQISCNGQLYILIEEHDNTANCKNCAFYKNIENIPCPKYNNTIPYDMKCLDVPVNLKPKTFIFIRKPKDNVTAGN